MALQPWASCLPGFSPPSKSWLLLLPAHAASTNTLRIRDLKPWTLTILYSGGSKFKTKVRVGARFPAFLVHSLFAGFSRAESSERK